MTSKLVPLSTFCKVRKGLSYKGEYIHQEGPALLGIGTIKEGGGFRPENVRTYGGPYKEEHVLNPGDVYVALTSQDGFLIGSPAKVPYDFDGFGITTHHDAKIDWKEADEEIREYLYWVMHTYHFIRHCQNFSVGTTVYTTHSRDVERFLVPKNPSERQRMFAMTLKQIAKLERTLTELNSNIESLISSLFRSWFIDFDPVKAKADGKLPYGMDEETAALFADSFEDSELGKIPVGWEVKSLLEVSHLYDNLRIPLSSIQRNERKGIYPYHGATSVMDFVDDFIYDGVYLLIAEDGSVLDENGYPVLQYVWGKFWVNNHAHVLQGKSDLTTEHLHQYVKHFYIQPFVTGAVQLKINQKALRDMRMVIAPSNINNSFNKIIQPLYQSIRENKMKNEILTQTRDALLRRLMSEELEV